MSLSIGIVGLPNVGKSTLFNALTDSDILAANYPFATIEPNTGIVPVPDERLQKLADLYKTSRIIPATVTFTDIAGLVAGASKGEGLGNQFLSHIRSCDAIVQVVRAFEGTEVTRSESSKNPENDIEIINTELVLADLQSLEKRLPQLQKFAKSDTKLRPMLDFTLSLKAHLENNTPLTLALDVKNLKKEEAVYLSELQLLTSKPVIYAFNVDESTLADLEKRKLLQELVPNQKVVFICAKLESELRGLDENDRSELLESYGVVESGLEQLVHGAYQILGLQSYLTAGEKEVRAWTIKQGSSAPQAAGVIHGDFERGFIAARVIDCMDLLEAGSEAVAKSAGKVRTEGKDYVMQPNDVVEFRFNV